MIVACNVDFFAPPPGALRRGQKVKYLISITKSITKICVPNFLCVLTNERYKAYQMEVSFCRLVHAPGVGLWGAQGVKYHFISNMVNWHIKSTGMTGRTECKLNFHSMVKRVTWGKIKRSNIVKF